VYVVGFGAALIGLVMSLLLLRSVGD